MSEVTYLSNGDTQCNNCGNVWDGHAQCGCWQWMYSAFDEFGELDDDDVIEDVHDSGSDGNDDGNDDDDDDDDDGGHTDSEDSELDSDLDSDLGSVIDTDLELLNITINLNTIFDDIEVD